MSLDTDTPVKKCMAKMIVQIDGGFTIGEADFDMGEFSYDLYQPHRLYLKKHDGTPVEFDENNKETFIELGIKGARMDGSPPKR